MVKCIFCRDGKCKSDYSELKCNGIDIPKDCPYSQNINKASQGGENE